MSQASIAFGVSALARGPFATTVGTLAGPDASIAGATTVGASAGFEGAGVYSTAVGAGIRADIVGVDDLLAALALGAYSIAIGGSNDPNNRGAKANGYRSIAIGQKSITADFGTSVGFNTDTAFASTAIGTDAQATAGSSTALGRFAKASATSSLALGYGAVVNKARAVAIGSGSLANEADTVSVGTNTRRRRIMNVAPAVGKTATLPTLGQVKNIATAAAETANADLQRDVTELRTLVKQQQARLDRQHQEITELRASKITAALAE